MRRVLLILALLLLAGCTNTPAGNVVNDDTITIGAALPLSGAGAYWGTNSQKGIMFAVEKINAEGGINGKQLEVIYEDTKCIPKEGVAAVQKLISVDKVPAFIGAVCSSVTTSVAPIAQANGIVEITPCSEAPQISHMGDYIFRTWTPNNRQAATMADFAYNDLGMRRIAIISVNNDFGESLATAFEESFEGLGGEIVAFERHDQDQRDMRTELVKIDSTNPDALYMTSYYQEVVSIVRQMEELGIDIQILGSSATNSKEDVFDPLGGLAEGIYLADLEDTTTDEFRREFKERFGEEWPGFISCASVAYDDAMLFAEAFRAVGTNPEDVKDWLANVKDYPGVSGPLTFDENGDLNRQHVVFLVRDGEAHLVE